mgnify:CR=1 FL=1
MHFLIEVIKYLSNSPEKENIQENLTEIYEYIHILCVEDIELIRSVIFEGFEFDMASQLVEGVEWMHACLYFKDELLHYPNNKKKTFYLLILSNLIKKYPTAE